MQRAECCCIVHRPRRGVKWRAVIMFDLKTGFFFYWGIRDWLCGVRCNQFFLWEKDDCCIMWIVGWAWGENLWSGRFWWVCSMYLGGFTFFSEVQMVREYTVMRLCLYFIVFLINLWPGFINQEHMKQRIRYIQQVTTRVLTSLVLFNIFLYLTQAFL